jgi:DNA mismatch endonuclease, patch repair protein
LRNKNYIRDKRSPIPKNENISKVMSSNRAKDTQPEMILRRKLYNYGVRGYRLHYESVPGKPDIVFISKKIAIFVNGCFWHRCPYCKLTIPKTNQKFWIEKFNKNRARDRQKIRELKKLGWKTIVVWECQILKNVSVQVVKIINKYLKNNQ